MPSAWSIALGITIYLPSAPSWHSAKHVFAECYLAGTRQTITVTAVEKWERSWQQRNGLGELACAVHVTVFAECRLWGTRQRSICRVSPCRHSANKSSPHRNGRLRVGAVHVTIFTECQLAGTRQSVSLPSANWPALGKEIFRRVPVVRRVHVVWHSANSSFAECSWFCTRQRTWHSAYVGFPVVLA